MTLATRLSWYAARMRAMSPAEIAWRARAKAASELRRKHGSIALSESVGWERAFHRFQAAEGRPVLLGAERARHIARVAPEEVAALVAASDRVLEQRSGSLAPRPLRSTAQGSTGTSIHAQGIVGRSSPPRPSTTAPTRATPNGSGSSTGSNTFPGWPKRGSSRATGATPTVRWSSSTPGSSRTRLGAGSRGAAASKQGMRALSVAVALQGLRTAPGLDVARYRRAVTLLAASAAMAWQQRSLFSSANNHLLGEMAGVATVAMLHPEIASADRLQSRALHVLAREAERQFLPDGVNAEQATSYQIFAAELLAVPAALVRLRGGTPSASISEALRREAAYLRDTHCGR